MTRAFAAGVVFFQGCDREVAGPLSDGLVAKAGRPINYK